MDILCFILFLMLIFGMLFSVATLIEMYDDNWSFYKICIQAPFSLSIYAWNCCTEDGINTTGRIIVLIFTSLFALPWSTVMSVISLFLLVCYFIGKVFIKIFKKR